MQCPSDAPRRGPWQGFFAGNIEKTNIVNAYNGGDKVLSLAWMLMQTQQKPNVGTKSQQLASATAGIVLDLARNAVTPGTVSPSWPPDFRVSQGDDPRATAFWAQLNFTTSVETSVFPPGSTSSNIIRQWAELSQWFPSVTPPVGKVPTNEAVGIPELQFDPYGKLSFSQPNPINTHTYLYENTFSSDWQAFIALHTSLQ